MKDGSIILEASLLGWRRAGHLEVKLCSFPTRLWCIFVHVSLILSILYFIMSRLSPHLLHHRSQTRDSVPLRFGLRRHFSLWTLLLVWLYCSSSFYSRCLYLRGGPGWNYLLTPEAAIYMHLSIIVNNLCIIMWLFFAVLCCSHVNCCMSSFIAELPRFSWRTLHFIPH